MGWMGDEGPMRRLGRFLTRHRRWGLSIDHLWLVIVLAGISFHTALVPLLPNDFWWHLKMGEIMASEGAIPTTNRFGWTVPADAPFTYGAWLAEYLFYLLYRWGGGTWIVFVRNVLLVVTFWLLAFEARQRGSSWRGAALAVVLAYVMTLNNVVIRPQIWSWVPFMVFLIFLRAYTRADLPKKYLFLCPLLMAFWVNVHGAFVLGIVVTGAYVVGEILANLLNRPEKCSWRKIRWLAIIAVLTALATLVNPQGVGIFDYVLNLMTDQPSQMLILEWQSPTPHGVANTVFFLSVLLLMGVSWYVAYRPAVTDALLMAGFLWLAWSGKRYVIWFSLVAMPIFVAALAKGLKLPRGFAAKTRNVLNILIAVLVFLPVLFVQPWLFAHLAPYFPDAYWAWVRQDAGEGMFLSTQTPVSSADYLRAHPGGHLFNEMGYGSYFIWAVPDQGVFIDPRVELYPYALWQDYADISRGVRYATLLAKYNVDRVVLDVGLQPDLALSLEEDSDWVQVYADTRAQIWALCPGIFCED